MGKGEEGGEPKKPTLEKGAFLLLILSFRFLEKCLSECVIVTATLRLSLPACLPTRSGGANIIWMLLILLLFLLKRALLAIFFLPCPFPSVAGKISPFLLFQKADKIFILSPFFLSPITASYYYTALLLETIAHLLGLTLTPPSPHLRIPREGAEILVVVLPLLPSGVEGRGKQEGGSIGRRWPQKRKRGGFRGSFFPSLKCRTSVLLAQARFIFFSPRNP